MAVAAFVCVCLVSYGRAPPPFAPLPLYRPLPVLWQAVQRGSCFDGQLSLARHFLLLPLLPMAINHVM